jgi:hypothetical protein
VYFTLLSLLGQFGRVVKLFTRSRLTATIIFDVALNDFDVSTFEITLHETIKKKNDNELS